MTQNAPSTTSPYARYRKTPWRYSDTLQALSAARRKGDHGTAERLAREHSRAHGFGAPRALSSLATDDVDW